MALNSQIGYHFVIGFVSKYHNPEFQILYGSNEGTHLQTTIDNRKLMLGNVLQVSVGKCFRNQKSWGLLELLTLESFKKYLAQIFEIEQTRTFYGKFNN